MTAAVARRLAALVAASAAAALPLGPAAATPAAAVPAAAESAERVRLDPVPASAFVDSVGVNVHLSYGDTNYARFDHVRAALRSMCVRHVRDNVPADAGDRLASRYRDLAADGVQVLVVTGSVGRRDTLSDPARTVDWLRRHDLAPTPVTAVEGPNEWDNRGGEDWTEEVRGYQDELARLVRADWGQDVTVLAPSTARSERRRDLGDLSEVADAGSDHDYPSGRPPGRAPGQAGDARALVGTAPVWLTETGYQTSGRDQNGQPAVTRRQQAAYLPRTVLAAYVDGTPRTYLYELLDEPADRDDPLQFGLLDGRMRPKGSYLALSRLLCLASGRQAVSSAAAVGVVDLRSDGQVHHLALRRDDGSLLVLLWTDEAHPARGGGEPAPRHPVTLVPDEELHALVLDDPRTSAPTRAVVERDDPLRLEVGSTVTAVVLAPAP